MSLPPPQYISRAQVATATIRFPWDEWRVNEYFLSIDSALCDRLDRLSDAANLALAIGSSEWISHRFSLLSNDPNPDNFIEAAWAAIVCLGYCLDVETNDNDWRGPIRGPLNIAISILHDGIHRLETDPHESTRSCWMHNLARHVLPHTGEYEEWFEACLLRLEKYHPWIENEDIWGEGPPLGIPVPREALDPGVSYNPADAPRSVDRFLRYLNPEQNQFLAKPADLLDIPGFKGVPYQYSATDWSE